MTAAPAISLPWFEGPLDLLLALIHKDNIDISDLPVADITSQYLDYLRQAEELDIDLGAEFAYMASTLIHIKSQCLLARDPEIAAREEDPRQDLIRQLLEHKQLQHITTALGQALEAGSSIWTRSSMGDFELPPEPPPDPNGPMNLLEVLRLARRALDTARTYKVVNPRDSVTVRDMVFWLEDRLRGGRRQVDALSLLDEQPSRDHRACLFLAMLELTRQSRIRLDQSECFGDVQLTRLRGKSPQAVI